jgi:hypothetical protein
VGIQSALTNSTDFLKSVFLRTEMVTLTPDDITTAEIDPVSKIVGLPNQLFRVKFTSKNVLKPE